MFFHHYSNNGLFHFYNTLGDKTSIYRLSKDYAFSLFKSFYNSIFINCCDKFIS